MQQAPRGEWYYSREITWIAKDTHPLLRRELYDRANRLWKILTFDNAVIESMPTVLNMTIDDVQSRSRSVWHMRAGSYAARGVSRGDLTADRLAALAQQPY